MKTLLTVLFSLLLFSCDAEEPRHSHTNDAGLAQKGDTDLPNMHLVDNPPEPSNELEGDSDLEDEEESEPTGYLRITPPSSVSTIGGLIFEFQDDNYSYDDFNWEVKDPKTKISFLMTTEDIRLLFLFAEKNSSLQVVNYKDEQ